MFCCDSEGCGLGAAGPFLGRSAQLSAPRPVPQPGARGTGSRSHPYGPGGAPGPGARPPLAFPRRVQPPRAAPRAEHLGQWLLLGLRFPGAHPARPLEGDGRDGETATGRCRVRPRPWLQEQRGSAWSRPGSPLPAGGPESTGTGSQLPAAPRPLHPSGSPWA